MNWTVLGVSRPPPFMDMNHFLPWHTVTPVRLCESVLHRLPVKRSFPARLWHQLSCTEESHSSRHFRHRNKTFFHVITQIVAKVDKKNNVFVFFLFKKGK